MCGRELCHACVNPINLRVHLAHSSEKRSASNRAEVGVSPYLDHRVQDLWKSQNTYLARLYRYDHREMIEVW
jgi:hypothetical protein